VVADARAQWGATTGDKDVLEALDQAFAALTALRQMVEGPIWRVLIVADKALAAIPARNPASAYPGGGRICRPLPICRPIAWPACNPQPGTTTRIYTMNCATWPATGWGQAIPCAVVMRAAVG
jgi:hypothetical protein